MKSSILFIFCLLFITACGQPLNPKKELNASQATQENNDSKENSPPDVCPEIYKPVCGQPPMPKCPQGSQCPQVMPQPKTYANDCKRKQAEASLIEEGECPDTTFQSP